VLPVLSIRALLVVTVFGVPGFGSNDDVQVESRIKIWHEMQLSRLIVPLKVNAIASTTTFRTKIDSFSFFLKRQKTPSSGEEGRPIDR
jgi:hypothetical protein